MEQMKKILPVEYPPITSFVSVAHTLSVLWQAKEEIMPWFCHQYIQLVSLEGFGNFYDSIKDNGLGFPVECPFFKTQLMDRRRMYGYPETFTDFLEHHISNDCYVIAGVDDYYVSCSMNYQKSHNIHPALIYGFDSQEKRILLSDFFGNKYTQTEMTYEHINEGDRSISMDLDKWFQEITVFKMVARHEPFPIDIELIKILIGDYIHCRDSLHKHHFGKKDHGNYCYGLAYYDRLIDLLCEQKETLDIKLFHTLYDHKVAMLIRLEYLYKHSFLDTDSYERLVVEIGGLKKAAFSLRQKIIKYNYQEWKTELVPIIYKCITLKQKEYETFSFMLDALKSKGETRRWSK